MCYLDARFFFWVSTTTAAAARMALPIQIVIWLSSAVLAEVGLTTVVLPLPPLPPPLLRSV